MAAPDEVSRGNPSELTPGHLGHESDSVLTDFEDA